MRKPVFLNRHWRQRSSLPKSTFRYIYLQHKFCTQIPVLDQNRACVLCPKFRTLEHSLILPPKRKKMSVYIVAKKLVDCFHLLGEKKKVGKEHSELRLNFLEKYFKKWFQVLTYDTLLGIDFKIRIFQIELINKI